MVYNVMTFIPILVQIYPRLIPYPKKELRKQVIQEEDPNRNVLLLCVNCGVAVGVPKAIS